MPNLTMAGQNTKHRHCEETAAYCAADRERQTNSHSHVTADRANTQESEAQRRATDSWPQRKAPHLTTL